MIGNDFEFLMRVQQVYYLALQSQFVGLFLITY